VNQKMCFQVLTKLQEMIQQEDHICETAVGFLSKKTHRCTKPFRYESF
jgi:hypothetical protein